MTSCNVVITNDVINTERDMTPKQFKKRREQMELSQTQLATLLGVSRNAVNLWEMGLRPILPITVLALEALEKRFDDERNFDTLEAQRFDERAFNKQSRKRLTER